MGHYDRDEWRAYILAERVDAEGMERHLAACEACLAAYMEAVELAADALPLPPDPDRLWTNPSAVKSRARPASDKGGSWLSQRWFHYAVAACITLLLTTSGLFSHALLQVTHLTDIVSTEQDPGIAHAIMNETSSWIDGLTSGKKG